MKMPKSLSVVIPIFNEEERLDKALNICIKYADKYSEWEFVFVNDGSTDKTEEIIEKAVRKWPQFKLVSYEKNQGKGYALKQGVKKAVKSLILVSDVDFSTPLSELALLYPFISKSEVVIASRKVQGAKVLKHQPFLREWLGKQFTNLSKLVLGLKVSDVTCGFKLFTKKAGKKLFNKSRIKQWGYDAEILFLAKKYKMEVIDVAVIWENSEKTKVSLGRDILQSLMDLCLIRWNNLLGKYS